jgi:hypothetical protein
MIVETLTCLAALAVGAAVAVAFAIAGRAILAPENKEESET